MGYTTNFSGYIKLSTPLSMSQAKFLLDLEEAEAKEVKEATGVDAYLQWVPSESLDAIVWNEGEKFYEYLALMRWLCTWLKEQGIGATGRIVWQGETVGDTGEIIVVDNVVTDHPKSSVSPSRYKPMTLEKLQKRALEQLTSP